MRLVVALDTILRATLSTMMLAHRVTQILWTGRNSPRARQLGPELCTCIMQGPFYHCVQLQFNTQYLQRHAHRDAVIPSIHYDRLGRDVKPHRYA